MIDKLKGIMYGLAIGDALGAAVEFKEPGTFPLVTEYRGNGPHNIPAGAWTDDTSMALALADSIGQKGWDLKDQLERYCLWYEEGKYSHNNWCFDIGSTTKSALWDFQKSGRLAAANDGYSDGNGSIMRLAPVIIKYYNDPKLIEYADQSSQTTHSSPLCRGACRFLAEFCRMMMTENTSRQTILDEILHGMIFDDRLTKVLRGWNGNPRGSGYVINSINAALYCFMTSKTFEECVLKAVNLGEDADTTGAVAGQMAGAYWGFNSIPQKFIDGLVAKDMIDLYLNPIL